MLDMPLRLAANKYARFKYTVKAILSFYRRYAIRNEAGLGVAARITLGLLQ